MKRLLTGAEALARGAAELGVDVVAGEPVRPVVDLLAACAAEREIRAERTPSDRVAVEVALGASLAGARAVAAVIGLSAVSEPLHAASYAGTRGLVVVTFDDPGLILSPVECDSRAAARALELPCLEPADAAECKDHLAAAFALSEEWQTPVVLRLTTRVALTARAVAIGPTCAGTAAGFRRDAERRVLLPEHARRARVHTEERLAQLAAHAVETPLNRIELRSPDLGVVTSGVAYHHVREALPEASVLKLGLSYPLPTELVRDFAGKVKRLLVVEEQGPFLEEGLRVLGLSCRGKDFFPLTGELTPALVARGLGLAPARPADRLDVPPRPPEAWAGCPHRALAHALKRLHVTVSGDAGCAALAALPPLRAVDSALAPGAAIGIARGAELALRDRVHGRHVALVSAASLLRSGAAALAHAARGGGGTVLVVADGVGAPVTDGVDLLALARALGVPRVREVSAFDLAAVEAALAEELARPELSVVVARARARSRRSRPRPHPSAWRRPAATAAALAFGSGAPPSPRAPQP
jgi:indolepyruvate ferredoxin oxidoreductase alpha subunit